MTDFETRSGYRMKAAEETLRDAQAARGEALAGQAGDNGFVCAGFCYCK